MTPAHCIAPGCTAPLAVGAVFCGACLMAPSGRRGGWLSAYRRRLALAKDSLVPIDASNIAPRLWLGGAPPFDRDLPDVDVLVLCARELQPARPVFHGLVVRVPIVDDYLEQAVLNQVLMRAQDVGRALVQKQRVLVTCAQGRNRSALVAGLALGCVTRLSADQVVTLLRTKRAVPGVLSNPAFVGYLQRYIGGGADRRSGPAAETGTPTSYAAARGR